MLRRIALTGNVASGKSSVVRVWRGLGLPVIEADELARAAVVRGSPVLREIVRAFGAGVLDEAGALDRDALRRLVLRDAERRRRLEALVHPEVRRLRAEREALLGAEGVRLIAHEIPLLFELDMQQGFERVVVVDAPCSVRLERLVRDRAMGEEEARRLMSAQLPSAQKRARADLVIENAGTMEELEARAVQVCRQLQQELGGA